MNTYDKADLRTYYLGAITTTGADVIWDFDLASGENAYIHDVEYKITTTTAGGTLTPEIRVGTTSDDDAYFEHPVGATSAANDVFRVSQTRPTSWLTASRFSPCAKGTTLRVTVSAATGGGAAGVVHVWITLGRW